MEPAWCFRWGQTVTTHRRSYSAAENRESSLPRAGGTVLTSGHLTERGAFDEREGAVCVCGERESKPINQSQE